MDVKILAFGRIAEITGRTFSIEASDTDMLKAAVGRLFPELAQTRFAIVVNKKIISEATPVSDSDEIALMPPYSGG